MTVTTSTCKSFTWAEEREDIANKLENLTDDIVKLQRTVAKIEKGQKKIHKELSLRLGNIESILHTIAVKLAVENDYKSGKYNSNYISLVEEDFEEEKETI
jgi:hypothetical protein